MAVFVLGDILKQLVLGPSVQLFDGSTGAALQASLGSAGAQLSRAASAVAAVTMGSGEVDVPVGAAATLAADGSWAAPWSARASGGATLEPSGLSAAFPAPALNNSALLASGRAMAELRAHAALPTVVIAAAALNGTAALGAPPPAADGAATPLLLTDGTILALRLRVTQGGVVGARGAELSLGSTAADGRVHWSEGALLYTLAPGLLSAPDTIQDALLPMVRSCSRVKLLDQRCD